MTPRDYREAWAWVHLFLSDSGSGKIPLRLALVEFGARPDRTRLADQLANTGATPDRLLGHLRSCQAQFLAARGRRATLRFDYRTGPSTQELRASTRGDYSGASGRGLGFEFGAPNTVNHAGSP